MGRERELQEMRGLLPFTLAGLLLLGGVCEGPLEVGAQGGVPEVRWDLGPGRNWRATPGDAN